MSEIIQGPAIAKIMGCNVGTVHYNMKNGFWKFGRVIKTGPKKHRYEATITETAKERIKMYGRGKYICRICGANLDPGEKCDCMEQEHELRKRKAEAERLAEFEGMWE